MTDDELVAALRTLKPTAQLPGMALFLFDALEAAGIDMAALARWSAAHGGGPLEAGRVAVRKGQRPEDGRPGRPQAFYAVPVDALG